MNEKQEEYILSCIALALSHEYGSEQYYQALGEMKEHFKKLGDMND